MIDQKSGIAQDLKSRRQAFSQGLERQRAGEQGRASTALQAVGCGAGLIGDIGQRVLGAVTPQPLKDFGSRIVQETLQTPLAQSLKPIASKIGQEFGKLFPTTQENLKAVGNIASLGLATQGGLATVKFLGQVGKASIKALTTKT